ncbi:MBOAT family O-acyltransferase [Fontivita pretiosa]|uniref:MBOAT family O-acyltransferase n=1 Tax=Fontivita pretiosa TaxID=2989684 RepID=UPI003D181443
MIFTTLSFIVFLLAVFAGYWTLRGRTAQNLLILLSSYFFYGWWDWRFCFLILANSLFDYFAGLGLMRATRPAARRGILLASLAANLGMLGFFKYSNFFIENLQLAMESIGWRMDRFTLQVVLPVGISFYTFQTMSYTIDIFRGKMQATRNIIDYLAYVSFFPQLVAGPIERAVDLLPQFQSPRRFNYAQAVDGCRQMLLGFFKKMVLADNLGVVVDHFYGNLQANGVALALATVCFAFQIYCDFSGYTDIAIGCARWFGFNLTRNFAFPYFSQDLAEFWRRWHITLSSWFRDYVYIPLGGSRVARARQAWNVMVTFIVSGLWHGASWNFVIWGAINGLGVMPSVMRPRAGALRAADAPGGTGLIPRPAVLARIAGTFLLVCIGWVFFRAATLSDALNVLGRICTDLWSPRHYAALRELATLGVTVKLALLILPGFVVLEWVQRAERHALARVPGPQPLRWSLYTLLVWTCVFQEASGANAFIYFQF